MSGHGAWLARACAAFSAALLLTKSAHAETEGERLFREGRALMLDGRFAEACPKIQESQRLDPHVGTLLNLAACHERQGKLASAWVEYQKALTSARAEGQTDRTTLAEKRISAIESRVPWLTIEAAAFDGAGGGRITLDGATLDKAAVGTAMPVDPGLHLVTAERNGETVFETRVALGESERTTVHVSAVPRKTEDPLPPPRQPVIVEPRPDRPPSKPEQKANPEVPKRGPWVLEIGAFTGYIGGGGARGRLTEPGSIVLRPLQSGRQPETCASQTCNAEPIGRGGSVALGLTVLGGYAPSENLTLGVRVLAAPAVGSRGAWGIGPTVVLHPSESFSVGLWGLFGDGSQQGDAVVAAPAGYQTNGERARAEGTLAGGFGAGLDVSIRLFDVGRSTFVATATPFFIAGSSGGAFAVPIGMAVRFQ